MPKVLVLFAHPRLEKSRVNQALLRWSPAHRDITFRDLYDLYPDFNVDIGKEQQLLAEHDVIVWQHPFYWYSAPPLLKQWIDLVLAFGWAYGPGGKALAGKTVFQVLSTGGKAEAYTSEGYHGWSMEEFLRPLQRTVTLCHMHWVPPFVIHGTNTMGDAELERHGARYAEVLLTFAEGRADHHRTAGMATLNELVPMERP